MGIEATKYHRKWQLLGTLLSRFLNVSLEEEVWKLINLSSDVKGHGIPST